MNLLVTPALVAASDTSMSKEDLQSILDRYPDLNSFGFGVFELNSKPLSEAERAKHLLKAAKRFWSTWTNARLFVDGSPSSPRPRRSIGSIAPTR